MTDLLTGLTKSQEEAVKHNNGPVLVVAGAGTGKTTVITRRIAWLINNKLAAPEEILALTFTDKAAVEMEERVDVLVPYGFVDTWISTFHAFCDRILRDHAIELDLPVDYQVLSEPEQVMFFKEHLFDFELKKLRPNANPSRYIKDLIKHFSKIKDEDISGEEYLKNAEELLKTSQSDEEREEAEIQREIGKCFVDYNKALREKGYIDFGDQIILTLKLLRENPKILKNYQSQFKYILVDEFQDTNYAQNELLKLLAPADSNLMVVGDDDQSIYRFRGAAISNILSFIGNWKGAKQIVLTENFRSAKAVLDTSYGLISQNNPNRLEVTNNINKKLIAAGENARARGEVKHLFCQTLSAESDKVAEMIKVEVAAGAAYKDIAILVRKNSDSRVFEQALNAKGIPFKFSGTTGLYSRPEIIGLISLMGALCDPSDSLALFHLSTGDIYGLSASTAVNINSLARKMCASVEEVYRQILEGEVLFELPEHQKKKIEKLYNDLLSYRERMKELTAGQLIYRFLTESGYLSNLLKEVNKEPVAETKVQNLGQFFERLKDFELVSKDKSLLNFYENLDLLIDAGENPATAEIDPDLDAVNILTVHKAKGLEFDVVFMVNLVNGNFPGRRRSETFNIPEGLLNEKLTEGDFHLEEERRLFYVGMTRAKKKLYLTFSEDHGGKRRQKVSQFVIEAVGDVGEFKEKHKLEALEKIERFDFSNDLEEVLLGFYEEGKTLVLTPHQIDDYLSCPLKFKYAHIFKIPLLKSHTVMFGSAVHAAVQFYYEAKLRDKPAALEDLHAAFERSWKNEGFFTKKHEEERLVEGKRMITDFYQRAEKEHDLPSRVEEPFSFTIGGGEKRVKINGRFDAVYERESGVEIRDFKTSDVRAEKDADKRAKDNRQISIYALSWQANTGVIPSSVSLYFTGSGLLGSLSKSEKDLQKTQEEIETAAEGIRRADFSAKPKWGECDRCAYKNICPFKK